MNKKLIAAAVSAVVVAPVAHAEMTVYGRINNAIDLDDLSSLPTADGTTHITGVASRFGLKGNTTLGNGVSVHGRYEFATGTDKEQPAVDDIRVATAGVSGGFGRVDVGNQWSAYNQTFGTLVSPTYSLGYYLYSGVGQGLFRASNTIKYSNTFGPVDLRLDVRLNDESAAEQSATAERARGDGVGLGLSFKVSDNITIAGAYDSENGEDDATLATSNAAGLAVGTPAELTTAGYKDLRRGAEDRFGIGVRGTWGGYWVNFGLQTYEQDDLDSIVIPGTGAIGTRTRAIQYGSEADTTFLYVGGAFGERTSWLLGLSEGEVDSNDPAAVAAADDPSQLTWAVYHNVGGGLRLYYEAVNVENAAKDIDGSRHLLGMRVDF